MADTPKTDRPGRIRLIIDTDDEVNAAAQLRASKASVARHKRVTKSDVVNEALRAAFAQEIEELRSYSDTPGEVKPRPRRKPPATPEPP